MKPLSVGLLIAACCVALPQQKPPTQKPAKKPTPTITDTVPVTEAEAAATFTKLNRLFTTVLGPIHLKGMTAIGKSNSPVQRIAVAKELFRYMEATKPFYRIGLTPIKFDTKRVLASNPADLATISALLKGGYTSEFSPVPSGPLQTLTIVQFGDAVGFFVARVMEYCHQPSSKWTPWLHP